MVAGIASNDRAEGSKRTPKRLSHVRRNPRSARPLHGHHAAPDARILLQRKFLLQQRFAVVRSLRRGVGFFLVPWLCACGEERASDELSPGEPSGAETVVVVRNR